MNSPKNWIVFLVLAFYSSTTIATEIVIPAGNEFAEGDSNNGFPFNLSDEFRYQQVYDATGFNGQQGTIQEIRFRLDENAQPFTNALLDLEVRLSHTAATPATLSTVFADNIGADETLVLSGVTSLSGTTGSPTNPFDVVLDIDDTFFYNGVDNLLLDVRRISGETDRQLDSVRFDIGANLTQRVWTGMLNDPTGSLAGDTGLVTKFVIDPVPEPASMVLASLAALSLIVRQRKN